MILDIFECMISLLAVTGFNVTLANDGIYFSEDHFFLEYNGTCLLCDTGKDSNTFCVKKVSITSSYLSSIF